MKNIVIIHLESVSKLILQMNSEFFPNVNKFRTRCMEYTNYYSTAASTAIAISDIVYGDLYRLENTEVFGNFKITHPDAESFVDVLGAKGYQTLGIHYPSALFDEINPGHMYAKNSNLMNYMKYDKAFDNVKNVINKAEEENGNFLIYFCNEVSHLCYEDNRKFSIKNPTQRWHYGYSIIDKTVGDIIGYLEEKSLMDNTVIILYGDHGDDFYCHDYNGGYAHAIEPYADIIHTPFMIYDKSIGAGRVDDIVCSLDVKPLVYNLAEAGIIMKDTFIFNKYRSKRKYVFSRNLYAGQIPEKIDACISNVRKSYAITTKEYSFILTNKGCRMYTHRIDPTCNNNVLDFFYLFGNRLHHIIHLKYTNLHYRGFMGYGTVDEIQRNYSNLKKLMWNEIKQMEKETGLENIINHDAICEIFYTKNMFYIFGKMRAKGIRRSFKKFIAKYSNRK